MVDQGEYSDGTLKAPGGIQQSGGMVFKGAVYAKLKANICGECGYTELLAEEPAMPGLGMNYSQPHPAYICTAQIGAALQAAGLLRTSRAKKPFWRDVS